MILDEQNIHSIPLSECETIKINGCENVYTIPNQRILNELIVPPMADLYFVTNSLRQYGVNEKLIEEIQAMFPGDQDNPCHNELFLGKVLDKLAIENYNKKLISILALEIYKFSRPPDDEDKTRSIVKKMSDAAVIKLRSIIRNPSPSDIIVKNFINKKEASYLEELQNSHPSRRLYLLMINSEWRGDNVNYKFFKYHSLMSQYIDWMTPLPINYLTNPNKDKKLSFFLQDFSRKIANDVPIINLDEQQEKYHESRKESVRRKCVAFYDYHRAKLYLSNVERILVAECPEYFAQLIAERHEKDSINDKTYRKKDLKPLISQQCQFCSRIREYIKVGNGRVKLACKNPECKERQKQWQNRLKRINTLHESTLKKGR